MHWTPLDLVTNANQWHQGGRVNAERLAMGSEMATLIMVAAVYVMLPLRLACVRLARRYERKRQLAEPEPLDFSEDPLEMTTMEPNFIIPPVDDSSTGRLRQREELLGRIEKGIYVIELLGCVSGYILWVFLGGAGWVGYALLINAVASEFYGRPPRPARRTRRTRNR